MGLFTAFSLDNPRKNLKRLARGGHLRKRDAQPQADESGIVGIGAYANPELKLQSALMAAGEVLKRASLQRTPRLTGHLASTAYVQDISTMKTVGPGVAVGYTAVYACFVHELEALPHERGGVSRSGRKLRSDQYSHVGTNHFLKKAMNDSSVRAKMQSVFEKAAV